MDNSTSPEGWHVDPTGRFPRRYHDGTSWTEHVDGKGGIQTDSLRDDDQLARPGAPGASPRVPQVSIDDLFTFFLTDGSSRAWRPSTAQWATAAAAAVVAVIVTAVVLTSSTNGTNSLQAAGRHPMGRTDRSTPPPSLASNAPRGSATTATPSTTASPPTTTAVSPTTAPPTTTAVSTTIAPATAPSTSTWTSATVTLAGCTESAVSGTLTNTGGGTTSFYISVGETGSLSGNGDGNAQTSGVPPGGSVSWSAPVTFATSPVGSLSCTVTSVVTDG